MHVLSLRCCQNGPSHLPLDLVGKLNWVATECLQRLIQLAHLGRFSEHHFQTAKAKTAVDSNQREDNNGYLVKHIRKLVQLACLVTTATASSGGGIESTSAPLFRLQTLGMMLVGDLIGSFAGTKEAISASSGDEKEAKDDGPPLLLLYEAQLSSAMRSAFQQSDRSATNTTTTNRVSSAANHAAPTY